jgi:hypothetical protein
MHTAVVESRSVRGIELGGHLVCEVDNDDNDDDHG